MTNVVAFDAAAEKLFIHGKIDFNRLLRIELVMMGYDPNDPEDVSEFWEEINSTFIEHFNERSLDW